MLALLRRAAPALRPSRPRRPSVWSFLGLRRSRARLATLEDHLLRDIGLTREQADAEERLPLWDVPDHWRR